METLQIFGQWGAYPWYTAIEKMVSCCSTSDKR